MKSVLFLLVFSFSAQASLTSPFKSSVPEITIPNTHEISPRIIRGMAPLGKIQELKDYGVTDILIFKNQTRDEIDRERAEIDEIAPNMKVIQMDFPWHNVESYVETCKLTVKALRHMRSVTKNTKRKMFLHCTVGEDRTGLLSGLWTLLNTDKSIKNVFKNQMCENGYEAGNPQKPAYVVNEIREDLTPLFMMMATKIKQGKLSLKHLTTKICYSNVDLEASIPKCENSSKY